MPSPITQFHCLRHCKDATNVQHSANSIEPLLLPQRRHIKERTSISRAYTATPPISAPPRPASHDNGQLMTCRIAAIVPPASYPLCERLQRDAVRAMFEAFLGSNQPKKSDANAPAPLPDTESRPSNTSPYSRRDRLAPAAAASSDADNSDAASATSQGDTPCAVKSSARRCRRAR